MRVDLVKISVRFLNIGGVFRCFIRLKLLNLY